MTFFKGKKNLKDLIGSNKIKYIQQSEKKTSIIKKGKYSLYSVNNRTLFCKQVYYFNANSKYVNSAYTYILMTP